MKNNLSLSEAIKLLKNGEVSSYELTQSCLESIKLKDKIINSYVTLNDNALKSASELDNSKSKKGRLFGVPFAIKDNFLTKGIRTTASSKVLDDYIPQYNATVVERLLDEGAIILGKTNMDAWAHGSSTETSDYGPTLNPWDTKRLPGGSSGGSAAATAADFCIASIGSETAGSVRGPAAWCGVVGFKPTYGRVSRYGVIAMGSSLDSPGPIVKSVEDAAIVMEVLAGRDLYDATTSTKPVENYTKHLSKGVKGMRIGICEDYLLPEMKKEVKDLIINASKVFEKNGAKVNFVKTLNPKYAIGVYTIVQRSEVSSNLSRYDGIRYGYGRKYFGEEAKRRIMLGTFSLSAGYADKYYKTALKARTLFIEDFDRVFKDYDLLVGPTLPGPAPKIGITEGADMFGEMADILAEPSSIAGLPGVSVPCGFVEGLPIGLNIFGPQFSEVKVFQAASLYEAETNWIKTKPNLENI